MTPMQPPGRPLDDPTAVRSAIFDSALSAVQGIQPLSNQSHTLRIENPQYVGPDRFSTADHKRAILQGGTLSRKLRGDLVLMDNATGAPVARKTATLANIPYYTDDGTFVYRGSDWTLANQLRLRPGIFTREKDNEDLEAHVNVMPGQGVAHRIFLDPKSGIFRARINQAQLPLVPMLRALGATDQQIKAAWGPELAAANFAKTGGADTQKLYQRLVSGGTESDPRKMAEAIKEALEKTQLDPKVSRRTLKKDFGNINADVLLATTRKLLAIRNRGDKDYLAKLGLDPDEADDRDHLAYMRLMGPEDMIAERVRAGAKGLNQVLWRAARNKNLDGVTAGLFDKSVMAAILSSGLGQPSESVNPTQIFEQMLRVSRMGYGGIPSGDSVGESSRAVQPSHLNYIDPVVTPESGSIGVDTRFAAHVRKGPNGEIYAPFIDKTGQQVWKEPDDVFDSVIGFSQRPRDIIMGADGVPHVPVMHKGKQSLAPLNSVDMWLPGMESGFTPSANLVAGKGGARGNRASMGSRMTTQALSLKGGEAPLVRTVDAQGRVLDNVYGTRAGAMRARAPGRVLAVRPDAVDVMYVDGSKDSIPLAQYKPNNRKSYFHQEPTVQPGQMFNQNDMLARSNYVDAQGNIALGKNFRVAYAPMDGKNFEDAIIFSRSAADRMESEHMYQTPVEYGDAKPSKSKYLGSFGNRFNSQQLEGLDDNGVAKPGTVLEYGDPIVLNMRQRTARHGDVSKARARAWSDTTEIWEHHSPGIVRDVSETKGGVNVSVQTTMKMQETDKVAGRYGNKGIVSVVPDDEMPVGEDGKPMEVLLNPLGVISRGNPAQVAEAVLGKIAAATGQPYDLKDFDEIEDLIGFAQQEAGRFGIKDTETLTDPRTGRKIPNVMTGMSYLMKLHHVAEAKESGRAFGSYTADGAPAKGGPEGSKTWGMLALNAMLSAGATNVAADASLVRGQHNPDYWAAIMSGRTPPDPPVPFVFKKLVNQLQAAGINPVREGTRTHLMALTNRDINTLAENRAITSADTVDWNDDGLTPVKGGLFDEKVFGGATDGARWGKIMLHEPVLNPVMEEPARRLLGLTEKQLRDVIGGRSPLGGETGPLALKHALERVNVDHEVQQAKLAIAGGRKTTRDAAVRKLGYLLGIQKTGVHPGEWMWDAVPVLPPTFRPISKMQDNGTPIVSDANYLYRDVFELNQNLGDLRDQLDDVSEERLALYDSVKAVTGLGDPVSPKLQEQQVRGVLKQLLGHSPKYSLIQRKLLGSTTDLVGRATIRPNADLDMDQIGIPEESAWKVYKPWIVRHLAKRGMSPGRAASAVMERTETAQNALQDVMKERPIIADRAPTLHRFGVMAFWPKLVRGHSIELSPVTTKGFGADFDGDAMQFHVPSTDAAVRDAVKKQLPSANLLAPSDFKAHLMPSQEFLAGLYAATTTRNDSRPVVFETAEDAIKAFRRGELDVGQPIEIIKD